MMQRRPPGKPRRKLGSILIWAVAWAAVPVAAAGQGSDRSEDSESNPSQQTGIDPTDIRARIEAAYTYNERANGVTRHNLNVRFEREAPSKTWNVRFDIPLIFADIPDADSEEGLGDVGIRLNYRYRNTRTSSALVGAVVTLDTAASEQLGEGTTKLTGIWSHSFRRGKWLLAPTGIGTWSDSGEHDSAGLVPVAAYQPMKKLWSYLSVGVPVVRDLDEDETIVLALVRIGKVFKSGSVFYGGSRVDLSGKADDDLVVTFGFRRMF